VGSDFGVALNPTIDLLHLERGYGLD